MRALSPSAELGTSRGIVRGWLVLSIRQAAMLALTIAAVLVLSHRLGPVEFASYGYTTTAMLLAAAVGDLGLAARLIRGGGRAELLGPSLGRQLVIVLPLCAGLAIACVALLGGGESGLAGVAVAMTLCLFSLTTLPTALLEQKGRFERVGVVEVAQRAVFVALALALAATHPSVLAAPVAGAIAGGVGYVIALRLARWTARPRLVSGAGGDDSFASHWFQVRLANQLNYAAPILLAGLLLSDTDAGFVVWALSVASVPTILAPLAARALFPSLMGVGADERLVLYRALFRALMLFALPLIAGLFVAAGPLAGEIFGEAWRDGAGMLRLACATALLGCVLSPIVPLLFVTAGSRWTRDVMVGWTVLTWLLTIPATALAGRYAPLTMQLIAAIAVVALIGGALRRDHGFALLAGAGPGLIALTIVVPLGLVAAPLASGPVGALALATIAAVLQLLLMIAFGGVPGAVRDLGRQLINRTFTNP